MSVENFFLSGNCGPFHKNENYRKHFEEASKARIIDVGIQLQTG